MSDRQGPWYVWSCVTIFLIHVGHIVVSRLHLWRKRRAVQQGTSPVKRHRARDRFFGLDVLFADIRHARNHDYIQAHRNRHIQSCSNTIEFRIRGRRHVSTLEPENLKAMQAVDFRKWGIPKGRKTAFLPLLGEGIFLVDGPEWQHSRNMLRPNFVRSQVGNMEMFEKHVSRVIHTIPRDNSTVNLADLFLRLTFDSVTEFLFNESTDLLTKGSSERFSARFTACQRHSLNRALWGFLAKWVSPVKTFDRDVQFVHDFVDRYVQGALARKRSPTAAPGRYLFIDELTEHTSDPIRIRSELLNVLLAGRDTTASLLTNVWWQLAQRPDVWTKLQSEIAGLEGRHPNFEQLKDLRYLRAILNESLRLYPIVPMNSRQALEDTTLPVGGGADGRAPFFVAKGERVAWSVYAMHRRVDFYGPDAEDFRPERWLDGATTAPDTGEPVRGLRPGWEYLPFNGGARICLGQQYALTEAAYTTVRLCQSFSGIESRGAKRWVESLTLTCTNLDGAKVALTPRN